MSTPFEISTEDRRRAVMLDPTAIDPEHFIPDCIPPIDSPEARQLCQDLRAPEYALISPLIGQIITRAAAEPAPRLKHRWYVNDHNRFRADVDEQVQTITTTVLTQARKDGRLEAIDRLHGIRSQLSARIYETTTQNVTAGAETGVNVPMNHLFILARAAGRLAVPDKTQALRNSVKQVKDNAMCNDLQLKLINESLHTGRVPPVLYSSERHQFFYEHPLLDLPISDALQGVFEANIGARTPAKTIREVQRTFKPIGCPITFSPDLLKIQWNSLIDQAKDRGLISED